MDKIQSFVNQVYPVVSEIIDIRGYNPQIKEYVMKQLALESDYGQKPTGINNISGTKWFETMKSRSYTVNPIDNIKYADFNNLEDQVVFYLNNIKKNWGEKPFKATSEREWAEAIHDDTYSGKKYSTTPITDYVNGMKGMSSLTKVLRKTDPKSIKRPEMSKQDEYMASKYLKANKYTPEEFEYYRQKLNYSPKGTQLNLDGLKQLDEEGTVTMAEASAYDRSNDIMDGFADLQIGRADNNFLAEQAFLTAMDETGDYDVPMPTNIYSDEGFFGNLTNRYGQTVNTLPISGDINGSLMMYPRLVPSLTEDEVAYLLDEEGHDPEQDESINSKAKRFAESRVEQGMLPYYSPQDKDRLDALSRFSDEEKDVFSVLPYEDRVQYLSNSTKLDQLSRAERQIMA